MRTEDQERLEEFVKNTLKSKTGCYVFGDSDYKRETLTVVPYNFKMSIGLSNKEVFKLKEDRENTFEENALLETIINQNANEKEAKKVMVSNLLDFKTINTDVLEQKILKGFEKLEGDKDFEKLKRQVDGHFFSRSGEKSFRVLPHIDSIMLNGRRKTTLDEELKKLEEKAINVLLKETLYEENLIDKMTYNNLPTIKKITEEIEKKAEDLRVLMAAKNLNEIIEGKKTKSSVKVCYGIANFNTTSAEYISTHLYSISKPLLKNLYKNKKNLFCVLDHDLLELNYLDTQHKDLFQFNKGESVLVLNAKNEENEINVFYKNTSRNYTTIDRREITVPKDQDVSYFTKNIEDHYKELNKDQLELSNEYLKDCLNSKNVKNFKHDLSKPIFLKELPFYDKRFILVQNEKEIEVSEIKNLKEMIVDFSLMEKREKAEMEEPKEKEKVKQRMRP